MSWYTHVAHFLGGAFLANALPHLIAGASGRALPTPFASPPFKGLSPPIVNVAWALINLACAYLLLLQVRPFDLGSWADFIICFAGFAGMALQCSRSITRLSRDA